MSSGRIDPDVLNFLRRAHRMLDDSKSAAAGDDHEGTEEVVREAEMRAEVVGTVVEQLKGQEVHCARHVFGSVALARVLRAASDAQRTRVVSPLLSRAEPFALLSDKYGSHVVEEIIALGARQESMADPEAGLAQVLVAFVDRLAEPLSSGPVPLVACMRDRYATHPVRALLRVLSGRPFAPRGTEGPSKPGQREAGSAMPPGPQEATGQDASRAPVPSAYAEALLRAADAVLSHGRADGQGIRQLLSHTVASPVLSELIEALPEGCPQSDALISALLKWAADGAPTEQPAERVRAKGAAKAGKATEAARGGGLATPPPPEAVEWVRELSREPAGSRALEAVLNSAAGTWWARIHSAVRGSVLEMAQHPLANFVVQAMAARAPKQRDLKLLLAELCPGMPALLASRAGVVWRLAQACARLGGGGAILLDALAATCPATDRLRENDAGEAGGDGGALANLILAIGAYGGGSGSGGRGGRGQGGQGNGGRGGAGQGGGSGGRDAAGGPRDAHLGGGVVVGNLGSRILEALLSLPYSQSGAALRSLNSLPAHELLDLARHPVGSRAVEAALKAGGGGADQVRQPMLAVLCAGPAKLVRSRAGCFVLGAAFDAAPAELQEQLLSGLLQSEAELRATSHGNSLTRRLRLEHFKSHPGSWAAMQVRPGPPHTHAYTHAHAHMHTPYQTRTTRRYSHFTLLSLARGAHTAPSTCRCLLPRTFLVTECSPVALSVLPAGARARPLPSPLALTLAPRKSAREGFASAMIGRAHGCQRSWKAACASELSPWQLTGGCEHFSEVRFYCPCPVRRPAHSASATPSPRCLETRRPQRQPTPAGSNRASRGRGVLAGIAGTPKPPTEAARASARSRRSSGTVSSFRAGPPEPGRTLASPPTAQSVGERHHPHPHQA
jgi:uncharacterized membrane protein YgcG